MRAGIYIRKSRQDKDKPSHRLAVQRQELPRYADSKGWTYKLYDDGYASAAKTCLGGLVERQRLLSDIAKKQIDVVLVLELSRLSRDDSMRDFTDIIDQCVTHGTCIATPQLLANPADPGQFLHLMVNATLSSVEMKTIKVRMNQGRDQARRDGRWLGGTPPWPYISKLHSKTLTVDPDGHETIKKIWAMAETHSAQQISIKLGIGLHIVRRAISDEYLLFYQGKRNLDETGETIQCQWPAILNAEQADRIRLGRKRRRTNGSRRVFGSLLTGLNLVKCGYCGHSVKTWNNGRTRLDGTRIDYYGCQTKNQKQACPNSRTVAQVVLDEKIITNVFRTINDLAALMNCWLANQGGHGLAEEIARVDAKIKDAMAKKRRLIDAVADGIYSLDEVRIKKAELDDSINSLQLKLGELQSRRSPKPNWDSLVLTREEFEVLDIIDQRRFLQLVIEKIKLYDSYAIIIYRFPRTINGDCTSRVHLPPSSRGTKLTIPPRRLRAIGPANNNEVHDN